MNWWLTWPLSGSLVKSPQYSSGMRPSPKVIDSLRLARAALGRGDDLLAGAPDAVVECLDAVLPVGLLRRSRFTGMTPVGEQVGTAAVALPSNS